MKAAVFGAGSWGTTFSMVLADAGTDVVLWARRPEIAASINHRHRNPWYQKGIRLPERVRATTDPLEAMAGADFVVLALPAQHLRENLQNWVALAPPDVVYVSLIKGIELQTAKRMSEVICEVADVPPERVAVVTGPNLAREIAERQPSASVVACTDDETARRLQAACQTGYFRPYTNPDVIGCELAGAVKNVIAVAVGIADGLRFGNNSRASLITRGLAETARLGVALGADPLTFSGLAGLGDLVATCCSPLSRNHGVGERLGRGMSVAAALAATTTTAEGVASCRPIQELARKHSVEMPIVDVVVAVLYEGMPPRDAVGVLMNRSAKPERHPWPNERHSANPDAQPDRVAEPVWRFVRERRIGP
ncbi:MAG: NAD(P)-dependent glycerol-3-phosphate dehydrogenase [Acidothermus cellulolyticus]|nr:NAD(P)-dependent glycerol-3-phosphate dehydrogenase [Acidothermus cellulolyticus]